MTELDGSPVSADDLLALGLAPYGHFTSIRVESRRAKGIGLHLERLARDCQAVFGVQLDTEKVRALARKAVAETTGVLVIRITIYDPTTELGHPADAKDPHVLTTLRPASAQPQSPLRAATVRYEREMPEVKHIGLFGTMRARKQAQTAGFDDAVFIDDSGLVSEGATWNIGFVREGSVFWPAARVLPGVTAQLLRRGGVSMAIEPVRVGELAAFEAAFATNTTVGVRPIVRIDDVAYPDEHPVLGQLQREYAAIEPEGF